MRFLLSSALHKEHQLLWKRPIVPLDAGERDNHLFCSPLVTLNLYRPLPAVGAATDTLDPRDFMPRVDAVTSTQDLTQPPVHKRELVYV